MDVVGTAVKQVVSLLCSRSGYFDQASLNIVQTKIDMLVLFSQPRGILVDNLTMTSDLADTLIREPGVR